MQLLVSIVTTEEVAPAVRGGADIIDVKNPAEGALGANRPHIIRQVRQITPIGIPVSATLGDLPHLPGTAALAALGAASCGVQYVKVGLLGSRDPQDAITLLRDVCLAVRDYDARVQIIACAYADGDRIGALSPLALPSVAVEAGVDGCLLDTFQKQGGSLLTELTGDQLEQFVTDCRRAGLLCALAGSLTADQLPRVIQYGPDIVGVRTAACVGGRIQGRIDAGKVTKLGSLMHDTPSLSSGHPQSALSVGRAHSH